MKINNVLLGILACGGLIACTNSDIVDDGANDFKGVNAYMGIKIALPGDVAGSRAITDGGYINGSAGEQAISDIYFAFYDEKGDFVVDGKTVSKDIIPNSQIGTDNIEAIADAVIALETTDKPFPSQIVAYVNIPDAKTTFSGLKISEAMKKTASVYANSGKFVMTNSVYLNGSEVACGTPVETSHFYENEEMARKNAVAIYVERLAAKVAIKENTAGVTVSDVVDAAGNKLKFELEGYALNGLNKKSFYLKNIQDWNSSFTTPAKWSTAWNAADAYRCFWAKDPNYDGGNYPALAKDIKNDDDLDYVSYDNVIENGRAAQYCLENTLTHSVFESNKCSASTHALLVGHYDITDKEGNTVDLKDFYYYGNQVYSESGIINLLASAHAVYTKTTQTSPVTGELKDVYTALKPEAYKLVRANQLGAEKVTIAIKASEGIFYKEDSSAESGFSTYVSIEEANAAVLDKAGTADAYIDSKAYFAVPIEHFGNTGVDGEYGVVRNHYYELTVSSIKSLGTGIYDPAEKIVPHTDPKKYYVGATLNILNWRKVSQDINI